MTDVAHKPDPYKDVDPVTRSCLQKRRFSDELTARAAAQIECERGAAHRGAMWIYACDHCRGWHLTNRPRNARWRVTAKHLFAPRHADPGEVIRTPQLGGFYAADGEQP